MRTLRRGVGLGDRLGRLVDQRSGLPVAPTGVQKAAEGQPGLRLLLMEQADAVPGGAAGAPDAGHVGQGAATPSEHPRIDDPGGSEVAGRLGVLLLSLLWALVPGFALIDLTTAFPPGDPEFRTHWFLEGSWGLLTTSLIVVPLLVGVLRPSLVRDISLHLTVVAVCCVAAAVICVAPSYLVLAVVVAMTSASVWLAFGQHRAAVAQATYRREWWPLLAILGGYLGLPLLLFRTDALELPVVSVLLAMLALVVWLARSQRVGLTEVAGDHAPRVWLLLVAALVGAGPWVDYAWKTAAAYRDGLRYTGLIDRIPAQSVLALAIVALPVVAGLGMLPFRIPTWTAAVAGAGFGAFAVLYPDHLGSPGAGWGVAAITWSALILLLAEGAAFRRRRGGL